MFVETLSHRILHVWNSSPPNTDFGSFPAFKRTIKLADFSEFLSFTLKYIPCILCYVFLIFVFIFVSFLLPLCVMLGLEVCVNWTMIFYKDTCKCILCLGAPACLNVFLIFQANKWLIDWIIFPRRCEWMVRAAAAAAPGEPCGRWLTGRCRSRRRRAADLSTGAWRQSPTVDALRAGPAPYISAPWRGVDPMAETDLVEPFSASLPAVCRRCTATWRLGIAHRAAGEPVAGTRHTETPLQSRPSPAAWVWTSLHTSKQYIVCRPADRKSSSGTYTGINSEWVVFRQFLYWPYFVCFYYFQQFMS